MLLGSFFESHSLAPAGLMKDPPDMVMLFLGCLGQAALLVYVFSTWAGIRTFKTGAKAGAILGGLYAFGIDFMNMGLMNLSDMTGVIADIVVYAVMSAIVGGVIGVVLEKVK